MYMSHDAIFRRLSSIKRFLTNFLTFYEHHQRFFFLFFFFSLLSAYGSDYQAFVYI